MNIDCLLCVEFAPAQIPGRMTAKVHIESVDRKRLGTLLTQEVQPGALLYVGPITMALKTDAAEFIPAPGTVGLTASQAAGQLGAARATGS